MKKYFKAAASFILSAVILFTAASISLAAPNSNAVLWREYTTGADGAYIQRLGHMPDGTPYMVFAQHYNVSKNPSETHWSSSATKKEHWLEITFKEEKTFDRIYLYFFENRTAKYPWESFTISYWKDGEWKQFLSKEDNTEMVLRYSFCGITSNKVRIDILDPSTVSNDDYARLYEVEIFDSTGKNVAAASQGASIVADSYVNSSRSPDYVIDGYSNPELGYWSPAATSGPHWIMLDFGEAKQFDEIKIVEVDDVTDNKYAAFIDYQLQYNAGTNIEPKWVDVASVKDNMRSSAFASFPAVTARQVRMYITKTRSGDTVKIAGFRVYNRGVSNENIAQGAKVSVSSQDKALGGLKKFALTEDSTQNISCITAYDLDGNKLWQKGEPNEDHRVIGSDLPIQIYDIDNDGVEEIITVYNDRLQVLSYDGNVEKEVSLYLQADSLMPVNVSGNETKQDILVKDRYKEVAVYDKDLNLIWNRYESEGYKGYRELYGHFPFPCDIDSDGKDEILVGNITLDHDGKVLQRHVYDGTFVSVQDGNEHLEIYEHSDGMKIADLDPDKEGLEKVSANSSGGTLFIKQDGSRYTADAGVGHAQKVVVGQFSPTTPGLEVFTSTKASVTNYPQLYLHRGNGERIWETGYDFTGQSGVIQIDPSSFVKAGDGQEYLLVAKTKKLIDSENNSIISLPANAVRRFGYSVNIDGDDREELLMWNEGKVQIWTNTALVPDGGKNLVLDSTITVDSSYNSVYKADALKDGYREGSVWKSENTEGSHFVMVDFGSNKTFDELWLYGYNYNSETYYPQDFKIQYNKGTTTSPVWTDILDVKNNQKKNAAFTFAPVTAQQVRIFVTDPTTAQSNIDNAVRLCEIEIYEALTQFTKISGTNEANSLTLDSAKIIDGVQLDFTGEVNDFKLQYLSNGEWKDILSVLCNSETTRKFAFSPVETTAVRVLVTAGSGTATVSAREYSGYSYNPVINELIVNPTKSGNTGSYRWTNY